MDTSPVTARQLGTYFLIEGDKLNKIYKDHLSGYRFREQINHARDRVLLEQNIGERLGIDETMLSDDLFTIVSNKDGHGRQKALPRNFGSEPKTIRDGRLVISIGGKEYNVQGQIIKQ